MPQPDSRQTRRSLQSPPSDIPASEQARHTVATATLAASAEKSATRRRPILSMIRLALKALGTLVVVAVAVVSGALYLRSGFLLNALGAVSPLLLIFLLSPPGKKLAPPIARRGSAAGARRAGRPGFTRLLALWARRLVIIVSLLCLLLSGSLAAAQVFLVAPTLPQTTGTLTLHGLVGRGAVIRNRWGVPYIEAHTRYDELFLQGFVTAQDQFFPMDLTRRAAEGRLAELLGAGPQQSFLQNDIFVRALGITAAAQAEWNGLNASDQEYQDVLAYSNGVNAELRQSSAPPIEYTALGAMPTAWTPADTLAIARYYDFALSNWYTKYAYSAALATHGLSAADAFFPPYPQAAPTILTSTGAAAPVVGTASASGGAATTISSPAQSAGWRAQAEAAIAQNPTLTNELSGLATEGTGAASSAPSAQVSGAGLAGLAVSALQVAHVVFGALSTPGSNAWVVDGALSATGHPLLANDPHLPLAQPDVVYQVALIGGGFDVIGVSIPGVPGVVIGHNQRIAWGITVSDADTTDLYLEQLSYDANGQPLDYLYDGHEVPLSFRTERIHVHGAADVVLRVPITNNGPIVSGAIETGAFNSYVDTWAAKPALAIRWTGTESGLTFDFLPQLNVATDWTSFNQALDAVPLGFNVLYADTLGPQGGNIGYRMTGALPAHAAVNGLMIVDGSDPRYTWHGLVPQAQMPRLLDPATHMIVSANNASVPDDYPVYISMTHDEGYRATRIGDLLAALTAGGHRLSASDFSAMQADAYAPPAATLTPLFIAAGQTAGGDAAAMAHILAGWAPQYTMARASAAAAVYEATIAAAYHELGTRLFGDHLYNIVLGGDFYDGSGPVTVLLDALQRPTAADFGLPATAAAAEISAARDQLIAHALASAARTLRAQLGAQSGAWSWGALHQALFIGALGQPTSGAPQIVNDLLMWVFALPATPRPGDAVTINQGGDDLIYNDTPSFGIDDISVTRAIFDVGSWDASRWIGTTGQSAQIGSQHWGDTLSNWDQQRFQGMQAMSFTAPAIADMRRQSGSDTLSVQP